MYKYIQIENKMTTAVILVMSAQRQNTNQNKLTKQTRQMSNAYFGH